MINFDVKSTNVPIVRSRSEWNSSVYLIPKWKRKPQQYVDSHLKIPFPIHLFTNYVLLHSEGFTNENNLDFFVHLFRHYAINGYTIQEMRKYINQSPLYVPQLDPVQYRRSNYVKVLLSKEQNDLETFEHIVQSFPSPTVEMNKSQQILQYQSSFAYKLFELKLHELKEYSLFQLQDVFIQRIREILKKQGLKGINHFDYLAFKTIVKDRKKGLADKSRQSLRKVEKVEQHYRQQNVRQNPRVNESYSQQYRKISKWTHERTLYSEELLLLASQVGLQSELIDARQSYSQSQSHHNYRKLSTVADQIQIQSLKNLSEIVQQYAEGDVQQVSNLLELKLNYKEEINLDLKQLNEIQEVDLGYINEQEFDHQRSRNTSEFYERRSDFIQEPSYQQDQSESEDVKLLEQFLERTKQENQQLLEKLSIASKSPTNQPISIVISPLSNAGDFYYYPKQKTQERDYIQTPQEVKELENLLIPREIKQNQNQATSNTLNSLNTQNTLNTARSHINSNYTKPTSYQKAPLSDIHETDFNQNNLESPQQRVQLRSEQNIRVKQEEQKLQPTHIPLRSQQSQSMSNSQRMSRLDISPSGRTNSEVKKPSLRNLNQDQQQIQAPQTERRPSISKIGKTKTFSQPRPAQQEPPQLNLGSRSNNGDSIINMIKIDQIIEEEAEQNLNTIPNSNGKLQKQKSVKNPGRASMGRLGNINQTSKPAVVAPKPTPQEEQRKYLMSLKEELQRMMNSGKSLKQIKDHIGLILNQLNGIQLDDEIKYHIQLYKQRQNEMALVYKQQNEIPIRIVQPIAELKLRQKATDKGLKFMESCNKIPNLPKINEYQFVEQNYQIEVQTERLDDSDIEEQKENDKINRGYQTERGQTVIQQEKGVIQTAIEQYQSCDPIELEKKENQPKSKSQEKINKKSLRARIQSLKGIKQSIDFDALNKEEPFPILKIYRPNIIRMLNKLKQKDQILK
ncbi:hypothetical protein pb186bvf_002277 [Paramecium bursaria]